MTSVRELRDGLGLSQQQLADLAGVHKRTVQNWERGRSRPQHVRFLHDAVRRYMERGVTMWSVLNPKHNFAPDWHNLVPNQHNLVPDRTNLSPAVSSASASTPTPTPELDTPERTSSPSSVSPVLKSTGMPGKGGAGGKPTRRPLTDEERSKLHAQYDKTLSPVLIEQIIEEALDHQAVKKRGSEYLYVRNWLRTETARLATERERQERAKRPYAPAVNAEPESPRQFYTSEEMEARHARAVAESREQFKNVPHPFDVARSA